MTNYNREWHTGKLTTTVPKITELDIKMPKDPPTILNHQEIHVFEG